MKAVEFAYWLQGYFEIQGSNASLTAGQAKKILERANKVDYANVSPDPTEQKARDFVRFCVRQTLLSDVAQGASAHAAITASVVQKSLNDLFIHAIDQSYNGDQNNFNNTHNGGPGKYPPGLRC